MVGLVALHLTHESYNFPNVDWLRGLGIEWLSLRKLGPLAKNSFGFLYA